MTSSALLTAAGLYGGYWRQHDQTVVADLRSADRPRRLAALNRAARYFKISRNFRKPFDVGRGLERLEPALTVLDKYRQKPPTESSLVSVIGRLRSELAIAYGKKDLLSASTKFLWTMHQDPVVIFDSQVRAALGTPYGDYSSYVSAWLEHYQKRASDIEEACLTLPADLPRSAAWFHRRVLDIYLWNIGATTRPAAPRDA